MLQQNNFTISKQQLINIIKLIDLTSLNNNDTVELITTLCSKTITPYALVPAICIYSEFITAAKNILFNMNNFETKIATVVNFPHGLTDIELTVLETNLAIARGANEIDLVFPYHAFLSHNYMLAGKMIQQIKSCCLNRPLKVILETGAIEDEKLITLAAEISITNGADFLKTSTGKINIGANINSVKLLLDSIIKYHNYNCGLKISGGVRDITIAIAYYNLVTEYMGSTWINANNFRFGASSLLDNILDHLRAC